MENLKKLLFTILIIFLLITSNLSLVTAQNETEITNETEEYESKCFSEEEIQKNIENETRRTGEIIKTPTGGSKNITFEDGYNGYCINKGWNGAKIDDEFKVQKTDVAHHNKDHEDVSNYLKILFTYHHDFAIANKDDTANIVWTFSDWDYKTSDNAIVKSILSIAESGVVIPDHGFVKQINKTTEALFDFEVLKATQSWHQSFFGYKITYKTIPLETPNGNLMGSIANNSQLENNSNNESEDTIKNEVNKSINNTHESNLTDSINENNKIQDESLNKTNTHFNSKSQNTTQTVSNIQNDKDETSFSMTKHATGHNIPAIIILLICGILILIKFTRD